MHTQTHALKHHLNYLSCLLATKYVLSHDMNYGWLLLLEFKKNPCRNAALLVSYTSVTFLKNQLLLPQLLRLTQNDKQFNVPKQTLKRKYSKGNTCDTKARGAKLIFRGSEGLEKEEEKYF